ncbi:MAG: lipopolysaccharide kinase InaA family protein [Desulfomonilia bacterium]|jgi:hypothetical protein|nr:hypothetical protein [Deltaproteobacteria bacterium]MDX9761609.1 lipopolysaccharide kinase InaA family protein [Desulfomonilia bacterium]HPW69052.1 lipopolysaccharide kinase InaA family protein [Deltaproteobacteria bacterium]
MNRTAIENLGYEIREVPPYTIVYHPSLPQLPHVLSGGPVLGTDTGLSGRASIRTMEPGLVIRTLTHGGALRNVFKARFLTLNRSLQELQSSAHLISQGIPTPEIVGMRFRKNGLFYAMEIISRMIPESVDLLAFLEQCPDDGSAVIRKTGALIRAIHRARVYHADLHVKNIVLDKEQNPWIIDLDNAYRFIDLPFILRYKNTRRFIHSLKKWDKRGRIRLPFGWKQSFMDGYAGQER